MTARKDQVGRMFVAGTPARFITPNHHVRYGGAAHPQRSGIQGNRACAITGIITRAPIMKPTRKNLSLPSASASCSGGTVNATCIEPVIATGNGSFSISIHLSWRRANHPTQNNSQNMAYTVHHTMKGDQSPHGTATPPV